MMDVFLPLFHVFLLEHKKFKKKSENFNFLLVGFMLFLSLQALLSCIYGCKHSLHLVIDWKTQLKHKLS